MANDDHQIAQDPNFIQLRRQRLRLRLALTTLLVVLYLGYALIALYAPHWFSAPVATGSVIGFGVLVAYAIIILSIVLSGVYVHWANTRFEAQENAVKAALEKALDR